MFVHHGKSRVEANLTKAKGEIARAWLHVDRLRDTVEPFSRHIDLVCAGFHALRREWRGPDELPVDEHLCPWHVGVDSQRAELGHRFNRGCWLGRRRRLVRRSPGGSRWCGSGGAFRRRRRRCRARRCGRCRGCRRGRGDGLYPTAPRVHDHEQSNNQCETESRNSRGCGDSHADSTRPDALD